MANPLDWAARAILQINGMKPEDIKQKARQLKRQKAKKPMPKAKKSTPKPKPTEVDPGPNSRSQGKNLPKEGAKSLKRPKPPARPKPGSTQVKGQTNLMNSKGQPRDFRNPKVSANRQPTTTPVQTRSGKQATPPKRPPGGFGNKPAGQGSVFGNNPSAKPSGNFKAPKLPNPPAPKPGIGAAYKGDIKAAVKGAKSLGNAARVALPVAGKAAPGAIIGGAIVGSAGRKGAAKMSILGGDAPVYKTPLNSKPTPKPKPKPTTQQKQTAAVKTKNYQRPKAQVNTPSAAKQATDKRDKKKLF